MGPLVELWRKPICVLGIFRNLVAFSGRGMLSLLSEILITCTCCYDESKGTQDQDFSCSFSDSLLSEIITHKPLSIGATPLLFDDL